MSAAAQGEPLQLLGAVPGVVGGLVFDGGGEVRSAFFPPPFDPRGLQALAERLSGDGYFQEWMAGEGTALELSYPDGHVIVRTVEDAWLLVLCTAQTNAQLLAMSMTQVARRLRAEEASRAAEPPPPPPPPAPPTPLDQLRFVVAAELGAHAAQALDILNAAGPTPKDLRRAAADVEKLTRLFIDKRKAEEIGRRMREILGR